MHLTDHPPDLLAFPNLCLCSVDCARLVDPRSTTAATYQMATTAACLPVQIQFTETSSEDSHELLSIHKNGVSILSFCVDKQLLGV